MLVGLLLAMIQQVPSGPWMPTLPEFRLPLLNLSGGIVIIGVFIMFFGRFLPKATALHRLVLATSASREFGYAAATAAGNLVGLEGVATSPLRPSGSALFGDEPMDVLSRGGFVNAGAKVKIVEAQGSRIVVEEVRT
jgi:membrane-bound serine protease (ClpP class)